jgi:hypothetical protein
MSWIDQMILIMEKITRSTGRLRDRRDEQWARPDLLGVPEVENRFVIDRTAVHVNLVLPKPFPFGGMGKPVNQNDSQTTSRSP